MPALTDDAILARFEALESRLDRLTARIENTVDMVKGGQDTLVEAITGIRNDLVPLFADARLRAERPSGDDAVAILSGELAGIRAHLNMVHRP